MSVIEEITPSNVSKLTKIKTVNISHVLFLKTLSKMSKYKIMKHVIIVPTNNHCLSKDQNIVLFVMVEV